MKVGINFGFRTAEWGVDFTGKQRGKWSRLLSALGDYQVLTRGFAGIAFPARYGDSGVMTFIVNHNGIVHATNLGPGTAKIAARITAYDPDGSWDVVQQRSGVLTVPIRVIGMSALVLVACLVPVAAGAAQPSRPAWKGCAWQPFESAELGIRLLVQDCADPSGHYVFSAKDGWLEQHRPSDDRTYGSHQIIRVLMKPADQTIQDAIRQQFVATLSDKQAAASCKVRPFKNPDVHAKDKRLFEIMPTGAYAKSIDKKLQEGPDDIGCGEFGGGHGTAYFEYHPAASKTKFLYVETGQDEPLFDEDSIEIIGP